MWRSVNSAQAARVWPCASQNKGNFGDWQLLALLCSMGVPILSTAFWFVRQSPKILDYTLYRWSSVITASWMSTSTALRRVYRGVRRCTVETYSDPHLVVMYIGRRVAAVRRQTNSRGVSGMDPKEQNGRFLFRAYYILLLLL